MTFRLLAEGPGWVAIDKPPGIAVVPGRDPAAPNLRDQLAAQLGKPVWVVHRLDRDTSGVWVLALDEAHHRLLNEAFATGAVKKRYVALVKGRLEQAKTVSARLKPGKRGTMEATGHDDDDGKPSKTRLRPLETFREATLVEAEPLTGRTHQIRVHLAEAGHPLLFDHQYGSATPLTEKALGGAGDRVVLNRTPLHARLAELDPGEGRVRIEAPLPEDLERALEILRAAK